jgi:Lipid A 3-O-deacylase (PagL)
MRKLFFLFFWISISVNAQDFKDSNTLEVSYLRGNVLPHTPDLQHLSGHPNGVMVNFLKQTHGTKEWQKAYDFPDYGGYFLYQQFDNKYLGANFSIGALYNFYFLNRNLQLKVCQGITYVTKPYDKITNSKNKAFGSTIMPNVNFGLSFKKENFIDKFGIQAGILFTHYSNGRSKSPNSGLNSYLLNLGVNYDFDGKSQNNKDTISNAKRFTEPLKYNLVLRTGVNESPIIGSGQSPFYHIGFYVDKRINRKSALQLGTELFLTTSFKDFIKFKSIAYPEKNIDPNTDYKRVGLFIGHELFVNRISLEAQVGYYIYEPFKNDISIYDRIGMKYYVSEKVSIGFMVKTHVFLAEALEFGVGIRL